MKKFLITAVALGCVAFAQVAKAGDIAPVTISTYAITEAAHIGAEVSGSVKAEKFVFSNSTTTATSVVVYKNCASTTTATAILAVAIPSVAVSGGGNVEVDYSAVVVNSPFQYTDMCFRKATDAADGYVKVSLHHR